MKDCLIIGVAGPTAGGKSTVTKRIKDSFEDDVIVMSFDDYYNDISHLPFEEREQQNFDHPSAFDMDLFYSHLQLLLDGSSIVMPTYDFTNHTRSSITTEVQPKKIIVVEGLFALLDERIRKLLDIKVYVETDPDVCFIRRLQRDTRERGRTTDSVIAQYLKTVKPMQEIFIFPTKKFADFVMLNGGFNEVVNELLHNTIYIKLQKLEEN